MGAGRRAADSRPYGVGGCGAPRETPPSPAQAPATPPLSGEARRTGLAMTRGTGEPLPSAAGVTRRCHLPRRGRQGCFVGAGALDSPLVGHGRRSAGDRKGRPYRGTFVCFVGAGALDSPLVGHARRSAERSGDRSLRGNAGLRLNSEFFSSPLRIHSSLFSLPFFPQLC